MKLFPRAKWPEADLPWTNGVGKKEFLNHTFEWVGAWGYNNSTQPKLTLIALLFPPHITLKQSENEKKKIPIPIKFTKICQQSAHFTNPLKIHCLFWMIVTCSVAYFMS